MSNFCCSSPYDEKQNKHVRIHSNDNNLISWTPSIEIRITWIFIHPPPFCAPRTLNIPALRTAALIFFTILWIVTSKLTNSLPSWSGLFINVLIRCLVKVGKLGSKVIFLSNVSSRCHKYKKCSDMHKYCYTHKKLRIGRLFKDRFNFYHLQKIVISPHINYNWVENGVAKLWHF